MATEKQIIENYLNALASDKPTPGGGSVGALAGSAAAALGAKVARLTAANKKEIYNDVRPRMIILIEEFEYLKRELLKKSHEDEIAFSDIIASLRLPKDDDEQREERTRQLQEAYKNATVVPFEISKLSFNVMEYLSELAEKSLETAMSDVGIGFHLSYSAVEGGRLNALANLTPITEEKFKRRYLEDVERMHVNAIELWKKGIVTVEKKI